MAKRKKKVLYPTPSTKSFTNPIALEKYFLKLAKFARKGEIQLSRVDFNWPHKIVRSDRVPNEVIVTGPPIMQIEIMRRNV